MIEFQLFRIKVIFPTQSQVFGETNRAKVLRKVISEDASAELRKGRISHIGNVEMIDDSGIYFRFGRTTTTTLEVFKEGKFLDQEFETAPYTHVLLDVDLQLVAIARKPKLARSPLGIARQLARLLQATSSASLEGVTFELSEINDPKEFIHHLQEAYNISKFTIWYTRPNPIDAEELFVKPFQRLLSETGGQKGKTELRGNDLNASTLVEISRSAGRTGDNAVAELRQSEGGKKVSKHLRGNPIVLSHRDLADTDARRSLLDLIRRTFNRLLGDRGRIKGE